LVLALGLGPESARAAPSVPATPPQDVYTILAQNPGLAASVPIYSQPQEAGKYSTLTVIGDSWGDWGNALQYNPYSSQVGADGRYGNALNIVDALQYHYALPTSDVTNYAFGGATTGSGNNNPPIAQPLPGFAQEMQALVSAGRTFGPNDLVAFTTAGVAGANDNALGISIAQGTANIASYVNTLVGLGARNILLDNQNQSATASLEAALAPYASQGVNIALFDGGGLVDDILADPTAYGFAANATSTDYCAQYGGSHVCNGGTANKTAAQSTSQILAEDQYLYFYAHPTTALAGLIAEDEARLLDAQTVPEPGSLGLLGFGLAAAIATAAGRRR
jgi:phospholipase/lecithinase/hemolysin